MERYKIMWKIVFIFFYIGFTCLKATKISEETFSYDKNQIFSVKSNDLLTKEKPQNPGNILRSNNRRILTSKPCSPGQYDNSGTCTSCGTMCSYCEDTTGNCLGCQNNFSMKISSDNKSCECISPMATGDSCACPAEAQWFDGSICQYCDADKYYKDSISACAACSSTPTIRFRSMIKARVTPSCCPDDKSLDIFTQKCYSCPEAKFFDSLSLDCYYCPDVNCKRCRGGWGQICDECYGIMKLTPLIKKKQKWPSCCLDGEYVNNNGVCEPCDVKCSACISSKNNCLDCVDQINMSSAPSCECPIDMHFDGISLCKNCEENGVYSCGNQIEKTCENSKVSFNLDFSDKKIIINFASNLKRNLEKNYFVITFLNQTNYDTKKCNLTKINDARYEIQTDLRDCDLPIFMNLTFGLA